MLVEEGFDVVSVDASDKMLKYALKSRWERRKEPAFDQWGNRLESPISSCLDSLTVLFPSSRDMQQRYVIKPNTDCDCACCHSCLLFWLNKSKLGFSAKVKHESQRNVHNLPPLEKQ